MKAGVANPRENFPEGVGRSRDLAALAPQIQALLKGEYAENELRKDFTPSERVEIGRALEGELGQRKGQRTDLQRRENFPEVNKGDTRERLENFPEVNKGDTRDLAALPPPVQYDSDKRRAARRTAQGP